MLRFIASKRKGKETLPFQTVRTRVRKTVNNQRYKKTLPSGILKIMQYQGI